MKAIEKLTEILCSKEDVKKDVMELRFWTNVLIWWHKIRQVINEYPDPSSILVTRYLGCTCWKKWEYKILWNNLEERHLRMYCESNGIKYTMYESYFQFIDSLVIIKFDNKKPFHKQNQETLLNIVNYLEINKK